ncbi:MAG: ATP-binding protein, partial [Chloroflexi bacterium]|nr:ATP-binding protein [Chloroflexota bacterium]
MPTVITSNHRLGELDERLRARLEDRLVTPIVVRSWDSPIVAALLGEWARGLQQQRFETFETPTVSLERDAEAAWQFAEKPEGWLVLVGQVGAGKTHLAAAIKNYRDEHGEPTLFMTVPDLLDYLRASFAPSSDVT